jgi:uncharacterized repeat protein (TIGR01451 family)
LGTTRVAVLLRRLSIPLVAVLALASSGAAALPAAAAPSGVAGTALTLQQTTHGAAGGPFVFELSSSVLAATEHGSATTKSTDAPVPVTGLDVDVPAGTYVLRQSLTQLPTAPSGGNWQFTGVDCTAAHVTVDVPTATATITLDAGAAATCVVTDTLDPAGEATSPASTPPTTTAAADNAATTTTTTAPANANATSTSTTAPTKTRAAAVAVDPPTAPVVPLAIAPLDCSGGTIYQIQRPTSGTTTGKLNSVAVGSMTGTSSVAATQVTSTLLAAGGNALGVSAGGLAAWALAPQTPTLTGTNTLTFTVQSFNPTTETWTPHTDVVDTTGRLPAGVTAANIASGGIVAGAIDPSNGNYYWAYLASAPTNAMTIFGWNTSTNTSIGVVANSNLPQTVPSSGSTNGDMAFDQAGNLYVVSNTGTNAAVGVITGPLPGATRALTPTVINTTLATFANSASNSYNGIAFDGTGNLFIEWSTSGGATVIQKLDPSTGAVLAGPSTVSFTPSGGGVGVDLAGCATPPTLELDKNVINRQVNTDQFNLAITGGGLTQGNTATTTGTANGVQADTAGPVLARAGTTYTFTETAAGSTVLPNYTTTWVCVDVGSGNAIVASGTGTTFTLAPVAGQSIVCTFTNSAPRLTLQKTSTATHIVMGAQVPYTIAVSNTGAVAATNVVVTDTLPIGLSFVSSTPACTAVGQIVTCALGTIAPNATSTIQLVTLAADPFPPTAIDTSGNVTNKAVVTSPGTNCPVGSTDPNCIGTVPLPVTARLTLIKLVQNSFGGTAVPTAWTLNATGPTNISGVTGSAAVTNATMIAGAYDIFESNGPPGYASGAWSCTSILRGLFRTERALTLDPGESLSCTLTNFDSPAHITLVKQVVNDNGGTALATDWTLTANGPEIVSGVTGTPDVTNVIVPAGAYNLSETGPPGYAASDWVCTGATSSTTTSVTIDIGQSATCTIVNNDIPATLTLIKQVVNNNGGTAVATQWTLHATGPTNIAGVTGNPAVTGALVHPGTYTLFETGGVAGYTASPWVCAGGTQSGPASITLALGDNATCTITNDDQPALLTLVKVVFNDDGGTAVATDWTLTATGPSTITGATGDPAITNAPVLPGTYALSETGPPNYTASAWVCVGGTQSDASITLALGQHATCTITNKDNPAHLTLIKEVVNDNGGTDVATDWTLTATGPSIISGATGSTAVTNSAVRAGSYTLSEAGPSGYQASDWMCTGGTQTSATSIDLALGDIATCIIVNDDISAHLTLVKVVINNDGGTAVPTDWTLTATGPTPISGVTGDPAITNAPVFPGTYDISESGPAEYVPTDLTCDGGVQFGASITVALGENVTCTITNDDIGAEIKIVKTAGVTAITPGAEVPYTFTVTNVSLATAHSVIVRDQLPVGLTFVSSPDGCTANATQRITCNVGDLAPGASVDLHIVTLAANPFPQAGVDPSGQVPNTATVTAPDTECPPLGRVIPSATAAFVALQAGPEDCTSTDPLPLLPTIAIRKTSTATGVVPGATVPYDITVTNTGPVVARGVVVTDTLPLGLSFVSSTPACTATGQTLTCPLGDIAPLAAKTIRLVTLAADPFPTAGLVNGNVVNTATASSPDSNCPPGSTDPACTSDFPLPPGGGVGAENGGPGGATISNGGTGANGGASSTDSAGASLPFTGGEIILSLWIAAGAIALGWFLRSRFSARRARNS